MLATGAVVLHFVRAVCLVTVMGLLFVAGCDRGGPPARPPTAVAAVGPNYYPARPNISVLSAAPAPSKRDAAISAGKVVAPDTTPGATTPGAMIPGTSTPPGMSPPDAATTPGTTTPGAFTPGNTPLGTISPDPAPATSIPEVKPGPMPEMTGTPDNPMAMTEMPIQKGIEFAKGPVPGEPIFSGPYKQLKANPLILSQLNTELVSKFGKPNPVHFKLANTVGQLLLKAPGASDECKQLGEFIQCFFGYVFKGAVPDCPELSDDEIELVRGIMGPPIRDAVRDGADVSAMQDIVFGSDGISDNARIGIGRLESLDKLKAKAESGGVDTSAPKSGERLLLRIRDNTRKLIETLEPIANVVGIKLAVRLPGKMN